MLRDNKRTSFLIALARMVEVDFGLVSRLVEAKDIDALAMLCRGARFDRKDFVTLCAVILGGAAGVGKAEMYGRLYDQVPIATAQRVLRFWKIRGNTAAGGNAPA
jgi:hypothetical protein